MDYLQIGKIVNTVGVRGEIKIYPTTDDPKRFSLLSEIETLDTKGIKKVFAIEKVRYQKNLVIMKLSGVDDMDTATGLRGYTIIVDRANALPLDEDQYYIADLIELDVTTEEGQKLGVIADVLQTGANDVYVVRPEVGKDILIPAIKQCVINVDVAGGKVVVRLMEGLMP
ncbi:MAG: ribosome maturation factor RimM [Defluviitaleaceae bacterium]|nr:ribosome maturation factor RimM [Defluviitaleaceae bacterium]